MKGKAKKTNTSNCPNVLDHRQMLTTLILFPFRLILSFYFIGFICSGRRETQTDKQSEEENKNDHKIRRSITHYSFFSDLLSPKYVHVQPRENADTYARTRPPFHATMMTIIIISITQLHHV